MNYVFANEDRVDCEYKQQWILKLTISDNWRISLAKKSHGNRGFFTSL